MKYFKQVFPNINLPRHLVGPKITFELSLEHRRSWPQRGCKSHPPSWAVHGGLQPPQRHREAGLEGEEVEQTGRNENEPHPMSLESSSTGDKPSLLAG